MEYPENPPVNPPLYHPRDVMRFWRNVRKTDDCWHWVGPKNSTGYGVFTMNNRKHLAHRVSFEGLYGDAIKGMFVCHKCDNRACVRPDHLFLGTPADNVRDMMDKFRAPRGERSGSAKLTWAEVEYIRDAYSRKALTQQQLADKYGVSQTTISAIIREQNWKPIQYG